MFWLQVYPDNPDLPSGFIGLEGKMTNSIDNFGFKYFDGHTVALGLFPKSAAPDKR
jgi:hypothetical protein